MPDGGYDRVIKVLGGLDDISAAAWDACAGSSNPFVGYTFLKALEDSGSVSAETGWLPRHIVLQNAAGEIEGCAPLYLKTHSYGEYVFDWGWADAYERAGGRYYPKLQCAVPFTPVPGPRLLVRGDLPSEHKDECRRLLAAGLIRVAEQLELSSVHITFCEEDLWSSDTGVGGDMYLQRLGQQFHWHNQGYADFDDFLSQLNSRKRKAIKKERRRVAETGLDIRVLRGDEIAPHYWDAFYGFYRATTDKKWGQSYLRRSFFSMLGERMADKIALIVALDGDRPVAGALNLIGDDCLYGRNWGALEDHDFLHFECCYYQAIDFAINNGLARVEAGAQGPHKVQRGYLPTPTYSLHYLRDPRFQDAVADFLAHERREITREMRAIEAEMSPYRIADED